MHSKASPQGDHPDAVRADSCNDLALTSRAVGSTSRSNLIEQASLAAARGPRSEPPALPEPAVESLPLAAQAGPGHRSRRIGSAVCVSLLALVAAGVLLHLTASEDEASLSSRIAGMLPLNFLMSSARASSDDAADLGEASAPAMKFEIPTRLYELPQPTNISPYPTRLVLAAADTEREPVAAGASVGAQSSAGCNPHGAAGLFHGHRRHRRRRPRPRS